MSKLLHAQWGLLEALLLNYDDGCMRLHNSVCGVVHTGLQVVSLSIEEGRSTFGGVAGILAKF